MAYSEDTLTFIFWLAAAGSVLSLAAPFLLAYIFKAIFGRSGKRKRLPKNFDYQRSLAVIPTLLDPTEARFYQLLLDAVEDDYVVLAKVDAGSIFRVSARNRHKEETFAELASHPVDFVLLTPGAYEVAALICVSKNTPDARKSQVPFLEKASRAVNLPYIHMTMTPHLTSQHIAESLAAELFYTESDTGFVSPSQPDASS